MSASVKSEHSIIEKITQKGQPGVAKSVTWPAYSYIPARKGRLFLFDLGR